ncbi:hypothetical protein FRC20_005791 [Serendipita sp. 405]|nr:hypothetical protein FRC20_005791 [Serendipita sp. 405]
MDTILKQNIPYDEQDLWKEDNPTLFVPADDDKFEFGGRSGQVTAEDEEYRQPSATQSEEFDETPMAHWHAGNDQAHLTPENHHTHTHEHDHGHNKGQKEDGNGHSHSHSHSIHIHIHIPHQPRLLLTNHILTPLRNRIHIRHQR